MKNVEIIVYAESSCLEVYNTVPVKTIRLQFKQAEMSAVELRSRMLTALSDLRTKMLQELNDLVEKEQSAKEVTENAQLKQTS